MTYRTLTQRASRMMNRDIPSDPTIPMAAISVALGVVVPALWLLLRRNGGARGRTVGDVMVEQVMTIDSSATLAEAAQLMRDANVGVLPVVEGGHLRGLLTDRDIVVRAVARGVDPRSTRVTDCATGHVVCARPEWTAEQATRVMARNQIGRLPVVDDDERLVGIVTLSSLALRSHEEDEALHAAQEVARRSARHA